MNFISKGNIIYHDNCDNITTNEFCVPKDFHDYRIRPLHIHHLFVAPIPEVVFSIVVDLGSVK